ncbi:unnamed protein product [Brugia timori]|uniref:Uncharacterized protein n=1 Tax=Brugia timori TaxID=42155 RepID=A0A0R3R478_9BILA|nr:unnamed protein product [Brugia timori]
MQIKDKSEISIANLICKGERSTELHIVCTFRHQIRPKTAISIEAHMVFGRPYYIVYGLCEKGSLVQYLEMNTIDLNNGIKVPLFIIFLFFLVLFFPGILITEAIFKN